MKKILSLLLAFCSYNVHAQIRPTGTATVVNTAGYHTVFTGGFTRPTIGPAVDAENNPVTTAQWHFAGQNTSVGSEDWIYGLITGNQKSTVFAGYSASPSDVEAIIGKLDNRGNRLWCSNVSYHPTSTTPVTKYDFSSSSTPVISTESSLGHCEFQSVTKTSDGYIAVGKGSSILIAEVDENGNFINGTPIDVIPPSTPSNGTALSSPHGFGYSVAVDPNYNSTNHIIVGGRVFGTGVDEAFLMALNFSGGSWSVGGSYYGGGTGGTLAGSTFSKILTEPKSGGGYNVYACGAISAPFDASVFDYADNSSTFGYTSDGVYVPDVNFVNKDIWIVKTDNTFSSASTTSTTYKKGDIKVNVSGVMTSINGDYTNTAIYPYQDIGPTSARNYVTDPSSSNYQNVAWWYPAVSPTIPGYYVYNSSTTQQWSAPNNRNEEAYDMTFTQDGKIAVITLVNIVGNNCNDIQNTQHGLLTHTPFNACACYADDEYADGDAFLLKIDKSSLGLVAAKNVGHFSGSDFRMQVKQDAHSNYVIAGSTQDNYSSTSYSLPDRSSDHDENAYIVYASDDFSSGVLDIWRRSFSAKDTHIASSGHVGPDGNTDYEDCECVFWA